MDLWQRWLLWSQPPPDERVAVHMENYEIRLPPGGVRVGTNRYVEFVATSGDVTYGFGVFRPDGTMVFQMQVVPGYKNRILWKFDADLSSRSQTTNCRLRGVVCVGKTLWAIAHWADWVPSTHRRMDRSAVDTLPWR